MSSKKFVYKVKYETASEEIRQTFVTVDSFRELTDAVISLFEGNPNGPCLIVEAKLLKTEWGKKYAQ